MPTIKIEYSLDSLGDITPAAFRESCERRASQLGYDIEFSEGLHNRETVDGEVVDLITERAFADCCR